MTNLLARGKAVPQFLPRLKKDKHIQTLHRAILRAGLNKRVSHQNTGRHEDVGRSPKAYLYAGLHISITNPRSYTGDNNREVTYFPCFDYPSIFRKLEKEFTSEIKAAYRNPGFYEVKPDGRVEYRSLPATLIHSKNFTARLASVLEGSPLPIDDDSGDGEAGANSTN